VSVSRLDPTTSAFNVVIVSRMPAELGRGGLETG
jgi:hypothetical protein